MTPFNLLGIGGYTNPLLASDSEDIDTRSIFGQMGANKRRAEYDNSLLGMVHNWATSEQRQPVQLPDDASWLDQAKEAGLRMLNLPNDMAAGGAKTMAHWMGAAGNPEMVEPLDMLAPLGIGAMAGMAGHLRPSGFVGEKLSRDEASARALGRLGDQPAIADRDMLPFEPMYVPQAKRGPPLMGKGIPTVMDEYNGWGRIYANSAKFPDDADVLRSRGASPMREAMNDAQDVPIDAYDRAALDRQWRQKVARTGELFADQSRSSLPGLLAGAAGLLGIGGYTNPLLASDSEDYTTSDIWGQMGANKRRAEYDNSLLGMVHNWATSEQRQPVQLPDDASWLDQAKEAGLRMLNLPNDMAAGGAKTMAHWMGAAGNPEMVEPLDMLAPLGIGAMAGMAGGLPSNSVGIFGGKLAKTADHAALARAEQMAAQGVDRDTIWKDTGWGKGVDGHWRFEIDDSGSWLDWSAKNPLTHPDLGAAYPGVMNSYVFKQPGSDVASYNQLGADGRGVVTIGDRVPHQRSAALHEMQHGVQASEGHASGGSSSMFSADQVASGDMPDLDVGRSRYRLLAGEVEARTVQKRMDMSPAERKARPPWLDYDVPENQQIVRFNADQSRSSIPGLLAGAVDEQPNDNELMRLLQLYGMMP